MTYPIIYKPILTSVSLCFAAFLMVETKVSGSSIDRPAGVLPGSKNSDDAANLSGDPASTQSERLAEPNADLLMLPTRSRLVEKHGAQQSRISRSDSAVRTVGSNGTVNAKPMPGAKDAKKGVKGTPSVTEKKDGGTTDQHPDSAAAAGEDEAWDSAAERLDGAKTDAANDKGVRVEDIVEPDSLYRFAGRGKSNPFAAPMKFQKPVDNAKQADGIEIPIVSPLQLSPVADLDLTGVWESDDGHWKALIETKDRQGIIAKLGDPIGNSGGRITRVDQTGVAVTEFMLRADGTRDLRHPFIKLKSDGVKEESDVSGHIYLRPGSSKPEMYVPTAEVSGTHPEKSVAEGDPGTQAPAPGDGHALPLNSQSPQKTDEGIRADQNVGH